MNTFAGGADSGQTKPLCRARPPRAPPPLIFFEPAKSKMADAAPSIECSSQPLGLSFHPTRRLVAAGLVDGSIEFHDYNDWPERMAKAKETKMDKKEMGGSSDDDEIGRAHV